MFHFVHCVLFHLILEFEEWKNSYEEKERCSFVLTSGAKQTFDNNKVCYYYIAIVVDQKVKVSVTLRVKIVVN